MRVAIIATEKLPVPPVRGGAIQIFVDAVAQRLVKGNDISVCSVSDPALMSGGDDSPGVHYRYFGSTDYLSELTNHVAEAGYDIIHVCNRPAWVEPLAAAAPGSRFVLSVHNEMFAAGKISEGMGRRCIDRVARITTVSDYIGKTIVSRFPAARAKVRTLYSGVDLAAYHPPWTTRGQSLREEFRGDLDLTGKKVILSIGRLSKVKGAHLLLQALPTVLEEHPDAVLVFVGSKWFGDNTVNNYVKHLYQLAAVFKDSVLFTGFVPPDNIQGLFAMADVFVCSSQWQEPLARVHFEAMAAGLPIITTNRGGNPEVVHTGENGVVIDRYDDPAEFARHINVLLDSANDRERLGRKGRELAEARFGWQQVAARLERVYAETRALEQNHREGDQ